MAPKEDTKNNSQVPQQSKDQKPEKWSVGNSDTEGAVKASGGFAYQTPKERNTPDDTTPSKSKQGSEDAKENVRKDI
ncbi:hypothetical protein BT63DRAFT_57544 [Microthyrium microscopicum]|uniref:Uncharacterized protein n=1 Tax=Microthyrium microscopicum TaxID=703497 RepID=A0A6A6U415_9PEZI|nr:hypothetical protein BT63DRAFT_57544 [Microthyrium microscopicum]